MCCEPTEALREQLRRFQRHGSKGRDTYHRSFVTSYGKTHAGKIVDVNEEFIVVRVSEEYRAHRDVHIRLCCLCSVVEEYSAE